MQEVLLDYHCFYTLSLVLIILYIHFRLKCNLLSCPTSLSLHVSTLHGHHQVLSILPELFHCLLQLHTACEGNADYKYD
jgi:hypothetical protein